MNIKDPIHTCLTLRREPDGMLTPMVDGVPLLGIMETTVVVNNDQQVVQMTFHVSTVRFETAAYPTPEKLN